MASIKQRAASLAAGTEGRATGIRSQLTARERRMEQSLVQDLAEVLPRSRSHPTLAPEQARGGIPAGRGTSQHNYQPGTQQGGGGIDSPLTETPGTREYHPERIIPSTDGAVFFQVRRAAVLTMTDDLDREIKLVIEDAESGSV